MPLARDAYIWRKLAHLGATRLPSWWVEYSPAAFGLAAAAVVPNARRAVLSNLERMRGPAGPVRNTFDVARTFATYAGCLAEVLATGSKNARVPELLIHGELNVARAVAEKKGIVMATAHTAGWETVGPLLRRDLDLNLMMVVKAERDEAARSLQDQARTGDGVQIVHVGSDPLASLPLLRHLRQNGVVALQIDRLPPGMRARGVRLFGAAGAIPEGPIRLAQLSGAPILPMFCARIAYRHYRIDVSPPIFVSPRASQVELDHVAQTLADIMSRFLTAHPTQWFHFG